MKTGIHPEYKTVTITCNGCGTKIETRATRQEMTIEICSNCHPFYTGKQKLVDVAGRVDKFRARQAAAKTKKPAKKSAPKQSKEAPKADLKDLKKQLEAEKPEAPKAES